MGNPYAAFCQDFYVNMRLGSQIALPHQRETVLHFCEQVQKAFPKMTRFRKSQGREISLEEDRAANSYRWMSLASRRLSGGFVNPETIEAAMSLPRVLLGIAPHQLGVSSVEIDYLDILFGFDLEFSGNHDEVIAESLLAESPLNCLTEESGSRAVDFQPTVTVALTEDCRLQARIDVTTRTNSYQIRTGDYPDDVISVSLILRRYWGDRPRQSLENLADEMANRADELCARHVIPKILRPISAAIAAR